MGDTSKIRIETYWEDTVIYMVHFNVFDKFYGLREIKKTIVLREELSRKEVEEIVKIKFRNVTKINHVDFIDEALILKGSW